jgi:Ca2+-binding RTX toxin-like protein
MVTVEGGSQNDTLRGIQGTDTKIDGKQGNDLIKGSNGDDLLLGSKGSDVLFGGAGTDTFEFTKFSDPGDTDYVIDWELGRDLLSLGEGVTIEGAQVTNAGNSFNGVGLANDPKVLDLLLTLHVEDFEVRNGLENERSYEFEVNLVDGLKNTGWHADQVEAYLATFDFIGGIETVPSV